MRNSQSMSRRAGKPPLRRFGKPPAVVSLVVFLASDLASPINGEIVAVDGGCTAE